MGVSFNGTSQGASFPAVFASEYRALTFAYWIRLVPTAVNAGNMCIMEFTTNSNGVAGACFQFRNSALAMSYQSWNTSGTIRDTPSISGVNNALYSRWHSIVFVHRMGDYSSGQGYNRWFADGARMQGSILTSTMTNANDKFLDSTIYLAARAGTSLYLQGEMAEFGIAAGEWNSSMALAHSRGVPFDKIPGCQPLYYFPMREPSSDNRSRAGNKAALLTYSGNPTAADHPPIITPPNRTARIYSFAPPAAGSAIPIFRHHYAQQGIA